MLPFLQPKKQAGLIIASMKPDGEIEPKGEEGDMDAGPMAAAEELISAVHSKDATRVAMALKSAYEMMEAKEVE